MSPLAAPGEAEFVVYDASRDVQPQWNRLQATLLRRGCLDDAVCKHLVALHKAYETLIAQFVDDLSQVRLSHERQIVAEAERRAAAEQTIEEMTNQAASVDRPAQQRALERVQHALEQEKAAHQATIAKRAEDDRDLRSVFALLHTSLSQLAT